MMFEIRSEEGKDVDWVTKGWVQSIIGRRTVYAQVLSRKGLGISAVFGKQT